MRISVIGTSGVGKSTLARRIAGLINAPYVELDAINWQAGWCDLNTQDPQEFRRRVAVAMVQDAWVSDGNYSLVQDLVLTRATHVVWLDYSRALTMRRVLWRSLRRAATKEELWQGTGNRETFSRWFDKDHPIRWAWDTYRDRRNYYTALLDDAGLGHLEKHRLHAPYDAEQLIRKLREEIQTSGC